MVSVSVPCSFMCILMFLWFCFGWLDVITSLILERGWYVVAWLQVVCSSFLSPEETWGVGRKIRMQNNTETHRGTTVEKKKALNVWQFPKTKDRLVLLKRCTVILIEIIRLPCLLSFSSPSLFLFFSHLFLITAFKHVKAPKCWIQTEACVIKWLISHI